MKPHLIHVHILDESLHKQARAVAALEGITLQQLVARLLEQYVSQRLKGLRKPKEEAPKP